MNRQERGIATITTAGAVLLALTLSAGAESSRAHTGHITVAHTATHAVARPDHERCHRNLITTLFRGTACQATGAVVRDADPERDLSDHARGRELSRSAGEVSAADSGNHDTGHQASGNAAPAKG